MLTTDLRKTLGLLCTAVRPRPAYVVLQLTRRCNLRCAFCDFHRHPTRPAAELGLSEIEALSDRLAEIGPCVVCVSGGEPTVRKDLPEVTRLLARHHFPTLITNGWFMTPALARALYHAGMEEISVSVDYATPDRHDLRRGMRGAWQRAIAALRALRSTSSGWRDGAYMNAVLLEDNLDEIEPLLDLSADLGVTFRLSLYSPYRGAMRSPAPGVAARLLALKRKHRHFLSLDSYLRGIDEALSEGVPRCQAGRLFFFVDAAADVYRCVEQKDRPVGNLLAEPAAALVERLARQAEERPCAGCWTSTRGSTEAVLGRSRFTGGPEFLATLTARA